MTYDGDPNFTMQLTHHRTNPRQTAPNYTAGGMSAPLQYISIEDSVPNEDISDGRVRIRVNTSQLEALGVGPGNISIGQYQNGSWGNLSSRPIQTTDDTAIYEVDIPESQLIAVTASNPAMRVNNVQISPQRASIGESVTVVAILSNQGELAGTASVVINEDGTPVTTRSVWLAPGTVDTVSLRRTFEIPGTYTFTVGNETTDVTVTEAEEPTTEAVTTAASSQGGGLPLGPIAGTVAILSIVGSLVVVWYRID
jgi:hypothetical protein